MTKEELDIEQRQAKITASRNVSYMESLKLAKQQQSYVNVVHEAGV